MQQALALAVLGLLCADVLSRPAMAQKMTQTPPPYLGKSIHLDSAADLEHLRATNLNHYRRARRILAAANEICGPGAQSSHLAQFSDADPHCGGFWMTSYPPKRLLSFRLDTVHYIALVTVDNHPGNAVKLGDAERNRARPRD